MKIEEKKTIKEFGELNIGTVFQYCDRFFMRTEKIEGETQIARAVNLHNGLCVDFDDSEEVRVRDDATLLLG